MKNLFFFYILIMPTIVFGQRDNTQLFEPVQIKADIDTLIHKLMDVHPTFLSHYKSNDIESKIDSIKNNINSPMSALNLFRLMQPIVTIDGHTTLRYTGPLYSNEENPLFPFKVVLFNNSIYIKENLSTNEALITGSIIEKINGVSSEEIINKLISNTPGEKDSYKTKKLEKDFHVYMALVYGSFSEFEITVNKTAYNLKGTNGKKYQNALKILSKS